ncbi:hypothetical protein C272_13278 [Brevibacterium casei S18]|uniref:Uncharacterized protein n=1 Tax=Brevibacterium casei S18 TaxID=1229781 RepID=K9AEN6_9MICO|nr:hypothetical protein C272_13278 [Brevibacterium casei S18]
MDEYRFRPGSGFLGHLRLEPPNVGAELIDVTLGIDSSAICTWLGGTAASVALSSSDLTRLFAAESVVGLGASVAG